MNNIVNDAMKLITTVTTTAINLANKTVEEYNIVQEEYKMQQKQTMENEEDIISKLYKLLDEKDNKINELEKQLQEQIDIVIELTKKEELKLKDNEILIDKWCKENSYRNRLYKFNKYTKQIDTFIGGDLENIEYVFQNDFEKIKKYLDSLMCIGFIDNIYIYSVIKNHLDITDNIFDSLKTSFAILKNNEK